MRMTICRRLLVWAALGATAVSAAGCTFGAIIGGMVESYKQASDHPVEAQ